MVIERLSKQFLEWVLGILGFYYGFMPEVARHRRSVGEEAILPFR